MKVSSYEPSTEPISFTITEYSLDSVNEPVIQAIACETFNDGDKGKEDNVTEKEKLARMV